jgi:outer membrane protein OmpA-like peptidoglycan-associated protein
MTILSPQSRIALTVALAACAISLTACQSAPVHNNAVSAARADLTALQADPDLASRAPAAIKAAEAAVQAAEVPQSDADAVAHLAYIAGNKVKEAHAIASTRYAEDQLRSSAGQGQKMQLDARTQEADQAMLRAEGANRRADAAEGKTTQAEQQAAMARQQTDFAGQQADAAAQHASVLEKELADLHAKKTDRGMVFTLGDVLFATGKSDLQMGTVANLDRLTMALQKEPGRHVTIEGHTDNVGNVESNMALSQRRADAVKTYLVGHGLPQDRVSAIGKGEAAPVMGNETSAGRQKNRRVEVIIENASAAVSGAMSN